ncbi:hypothetical protein C100_02535 [Sphingobium sp. C100]|nr:hypothetical protein C100_02535 [Sphingobium sp. C100]
MAGATPVRKSAIFDIVFTIQSLALEMQLKLLFDA